MKNIKQTHSHSRVKQYSLGIIAVACFVSLLPTEASAASFLNTVKGWGNDIKDGTTNVGNTIANGVQKGVDYTRMGVDEISNSVGELDDYAKSMLREGIEKGLEVAFGQLKDVGLGVLADTRKFGDPDLWLREITQVVMSDMAGEKVADTGAETASYIQNQIGQFSEASPFGNGPVGRQLQAEVEKTYKKALQYTTVAGEKTVDYLNPVHNPIYATPEDFKTAKAMFSFDLPNFTRFTYGIDLQIKPLDVTVDNPKLPFLLKGNISTTFPLISGDKSGATTIFTNAVDDQKFNFSIAAMAGIKSREVAGTTDDRSISYKDSLKFDVSCSIANIGICQLTKIANERKIELSRKANAQLTEKIRRAMGGVIKVVGYMKRLEIMDDGKVDQLTTVLRHIESTIERPLGLVDKFDQIVFVADSTADKALHRHSDIGAITYLTAALTEIPDLKYEGKGTDFKRTLSLTDNETADVSYVFEWHNADVKNGIFKPGFAYIGNNPMVDIIGLKIGKGISTEASFKLSGLDPTDSEGKPVKGEDGKDLKASKNSVSASISVATAAGFGVYLPVKIDVMKSYGSFDRNFRNSCMSDSLEQKSSSSSGWSTPNNQLHKKDRSAKKPSSVSQITTSISSEGSGNQCMSDAARKITANLKGSFGDRVGLGASKQWANPPEMQELEGALQLTDKLNLATYIAVSGN